MPGMRSLVSELSSRSRDRLMQCWCPVNAFSFVNLYQVDLLRTDVLCHRTCFFFCLARMQCLRIDCCSSGM